MRWAYEICPISTTHLTQAVRQPSMSAAQQNRNIAWNMNEFPVLRQMEEQRLRPVVGVVEELRERHPSPLPQNVSRYGVASA